MTKVLAIGVATIDIINRVHHYPLEDEKLRAQSQSVQRGGNAANTLVVLNQLGHQCSFAGVLSSSQDANFILDDLRQYNIDTGYCPVALSGHTPTSYITLNNENGSRTIVHHRDLREFNFNDFIKIDTTPFDWIHFEGREVDETVRMMQHVKTNNADKTISVEIEKPRTAIESLIDYADTVFFSQTYAQSQGYKNAKKFLSRILKDYKGKDLVCTWGDKDTAATSFDTDIVTCPVSPPENIIDTVAAGDTFIAAYINARLNNETSETAIQKANLLAGKKCGQTGLDDLV